MQIKRATNERSRQIGEGEIVLMINLTITMTKYAEAENDIGNKYDLTLN